MHIKNKNTLFFLGLIIVNIIWIFLTITGFLKNLDQQIYTWAIGQRISFLNQFIESITEQSGFFAFVLFFPTIIYLNKKVTQKWLDKNDKIIVLVCFFYMLTAVGMKYIYQIPRPPLENMLNFEPSFSFPSGHTAAAMSITASLYYFLNKWFHINKNKLRIFCISFLIIIGYTRLYLGVHWFSDVFGSVLLGVCYWQMARILLKRHVKQAKLAQ